MSESVSRILKVLQRFIFLNCPPYLLQVCVKLTPTQLHIAVAGRVILNGKLCHEIKQEDSMWLLEDSILHLTMLKRNRRGNYADKCTTADTFWQAVLQNGVDQERLQLALPPARYYHLPFDTADSTARAELKA